MKASGIFIIAVYALSSGCSTQSGVPEALQKEEAYIGVAEMRADGTIILQLRASLPDGSGEGYFVYPKTHPEYQDILKHVAPLEPGQSTPVRPWPEIKSEPNQTPEPTPTAVTPDADASVAPSAGAAHL